MKLSPTPSLSEEPTLSIHTQVRWCLIVDTFGGCRFWAAGSASAVRRSVLKTWEASAQKAFSGNSGRQRDLKEDCVAAWILKV